MNKTNNYAHKLCFYHPNGKGTGSAASFALRLPNANSNGHIEMCIANQIAMVDTRGEIPTFPGFGTAVRVNLDFSDICKILQVFRGEVENIEDGNGLLHINEHYNQRICVEHIIEPKCGYRIKVCQSRRGSKEESRYDLFVHCHEAIGLTEVFCSSLSLIAFGLPSFTLEFKQ